MKAYVESMGCDSNIADANKVKKYLMANNVELVSNPKDADYIFFMSCGFNKIVLNDNLARLEELKKTNAKIILGGCIPKIKESVTDTVDFFFNPRELEKLDEYFNYEFKMNNFSPSFEREGKKTIRISTGCEGNCTYCVIKRANGRTKSRPICDIVKDIEKGLKEGFNKFIFTSEDTGSWGQDIGKNITDLMRSVNKIDGEFKVALTTFNPQWFMKYPEIYELLKMGKIDEKIYLPLQSGSNKILKLMNRGYTVEDYLNIFNRLKKELPRIKIQVDVLVGFPKETSEDFNETVKVLSELDVYFLQVFVYTDMEDVPSSKITPKVPFELSKNRAKEIISSFLEKYKNDHKRLIHTNLNDLNSNN